MASLAVGLFATTAVALLNVFFGIPIHYLTRDVAAITGSSFYVGVLSSLGIMLWAVNVGICFFAASLLRCAPHRSPDCLFLLCSGLLCSMLMVDDAFVLHEEVFPRHLNIPQNAVFSAYFVITGAYLLYFSRHILTTDYLLFVAAFLFLGSSLLTDLASPDTGVGLLIEDGLKFFGIVFWLGYSAHTAFIALRKDHETSRSVY